MLAFEARHHWEIANLDHGRVQAFARAVNGPSILAQLLLLRGVDTADKARDFLHPRLQHLSDPFLLTDMDAAVDRIAHARRRKERVFVAGDFDVDGISATAVMVSALKRYGIEDVSFSIPLRLSEGYGIRPSHVEQAREEGATLIVTVDNGITAHAAAARARELGIDLIITDHHALDTTLPEAAAVINPKREDPSYPGWNLCGAAVAFKLGMALNGTPNDLDIVALGTVADVMPLVGENRVLVALGLKHMATHQRMGLAKLAESARFDLADVSSQRIGFQLGPRLNAAGRLDDGLVALELLLSDCPLEAGKMARQLEQANEKRRAIERDIFEEAREELEETLQDDQRGIVLARPDWHAGVIGIVAARIQGHYGRPTILLTAGEEGLLRGSCRSGPGFDMVQALAACEEMLIQFGGHKAAAGLSLHADRLDAFRGAFEEEVRRQVGGEELVESLPIDAVASFSQINGELLNGLARLEPFGQANPQPVFCSMGVEARPEEVRILKDAHLKMTLRQGDHLMPAIGFGMAERFYADDFPRLLDVAYAPQYNTWRGETTIQLQLKDIRPAR